MVYRSERLIFVPAFDLDISRSQSAEGNDKGTCQSGIRDQRNVEVDCTASDRVVVVQLILRQVFRDVNHQIDLLLLDVVQRVGLLFLIGPVQNRRMNAIQFEELSGTLGCEDVVSAVLQSFGG